MKLVQATTLYTVKYQNQGLNNNTMKHNFGRLWRGNWPYAPMQGVGLKFVGMPTNSDVWFDLLATHGCHPDAAQRILDNLKQHGQVCATVSPDRKFEILAAWLNTIGVKMTIVPPKHTPSNNSSIWPQKLIDRLGQLRVKYVQLPPDYED